MIDALLAGCRVTRLLALSFTLGGSCVSACERVCVAPPRCLRFGQYTVVLRLDTAP